MCVALALAALLALAAPAALAHDKRWGVAVSFEFKPANGDQDTSWTGVVRSRKEACRKQRRVQVLRRAQGPDELIGSDRTAVAPDGDPLPWEVVQQGYPPAAGDYYVRVLRRMLTRNRRHRHVCLGIRTEAVTVKARR